MPYIIYGDPESILKRIEGCAVDREKSSTTRIREYIPCEHSVSTIWTFDGIVKKHNVYRGEGCMKKFRESIRKHAMEIINFENKKMVPLTKEQRELNKKSKIFYIWEIKFKQNYAKDKNYHKVRNHCHYPGKYRATAHSICNLKYTVPNEILVAFYLS